MEQSTKNRSIIYICSRLKGDIQRNIIKANIYCRAAYKMGYIPLAPHCIFSQFLDDRIKAERADGMAMGLQILRPCSELWVVSDAAVYESSWSDGMRKEIAFARKLKKKIRFFDEDMNEQNAEEKHDG